jgi:hypothetical protein
MITQAEIQIAMEINFGIRSRMPYGCGCWCKYIFPLESLSLNRLHEKVNESVNESMNYFLKKLLEIIISKNCK